MFDIEFFSFSMLSVKMAIHTNSSVITGDRTIVKLSGQFNYMLWSSNFHMRSTSIVDAKLFKVDYYYSTFPYRH